MGSKDDNRTKVTVEGVTLAHGSATKNGGAILNFGNLTIRNSSFVDNRAPEDGGAISNEGRGARLHVFNSTFLGNSGIEAGIEQEEGGNLDDGTSCGLTFGPSLPNGNARLDPLGLRDNGGPTDTVGLTAASEALDLGLDSFCAASPVNNLDQRGEPRPTDGDLPAITPTSTSAAFAAAARPGYARRSKPAGTMRRLHMPARRPLRRDRGLGHTVQGWDRYLRPCARPAFPRRRVGQGAQADPIRPG